MSMSENGNIEEVMLRYLNGESTSEEENLLHEWINKSQSNAKEFELTKKLWFDSAEAVKLPVDTEKAWETVASKTIGKKAKIVGLFPWRKALAVAASIILIIGVFYYFNQSSETTWEVIASVNSDKKIQLSDGTEVTLRQGSQLSIPENFGKAIRQVKFEGEAFFEIKHDGSIPFSIITSRSIIKDIGTSFLVQSMDSIEQVTVVEGTVSFTNKDKEEVQIILKVGESAILENEMLQKKKVQTDNLLSWNSKILSFKNTPLSQVVIDLENYYRIDVVLSQSLRNIEITAEFRNESLEQVIKELQLFTGLQYQMKENTLIISK